MAIANMLRKKVTPVITASAYADNDTFGVPTTGVMFTPNSPRSIVIDALLLKLAHTAGIDMDIYVTSGVLATPPVDNDAFSITVAQLRPVMKAKIAVLATDWEQVGSNNLFVLSMNIVPFLVRAGAAHSVFCQAKTAITPAAVNPLDIEFNVTELE